MTYYDLTIDKYLQIKEILEEGTDDLNIQVQMIAVLDECDEDDVLDLPIDEYKEKVRMIDFLSSPVVPSPKCPKTITIAGQVYETVQDIKKFTAGQYIDYETLMKSEDFYAHIPNILACLFIPKGKDYGKDYDIMEVADKIRYNVSIGMAIDVCFFFMMKSRRLINRMLDCLVLETKIQMRKTRNREVKTKMKEALMKIQELQDSLENGTGFTALT